MIMLIMQNQMDNKQNEMNTTIQGRAMIEVDPHRIGTEPLSKHKVPF